MKDEGILKLIHIETYLDLQVEECQKEIVKGNKFYDELKEYFENGREFISEIIDNTEMSFFTPTGKKL